MTTKRIEARLAIKAIDQYSKTLKGMQTVTGRFADGVRSKMRGVQAIRGPLQLIEDFAKQRRVVRESGAALDAAREKQRRLLAEIKKTKNPTAGMRREFDRARAAAERLGEQHRRQREVLNGLHGQLKRAGVNTADLAGEQRRLASAADQATKVLDRQMDRMRDLEAMQVRIAKGRERMDRSLATAANVSFVGHASEQSGRRILRALNGPLQGAIEFESAMSDVRKVVDFETPQAFAQMSEDILKLSTRIPMAAEDLAQIVAAGGQSGIDQSELTRFAEMAAKIGVAFDISAEHAGNSMASIRTAMGLTLDQTGTLFDAMNHLSNNSAARADQTLDFINRAGASGATFGFTENETLAIGAAMIAAGAGADTAATSFRNMGRALTRGESATDRQALAMKKLGLDAVQVARDMQRDAVGTTSDVLQRLREAPDHLRASLMSDIFGDEARELTKLINNAELLPELLALVADEQRYLGSAEAEYSARAATTQNNAQLTRNQLSLLGKTIGEVVLPPYNELLTMTQAVVERMVEWTKAHPKLTKWLVFGGVAVGGMAVAAGALLTATAGLIGALAVLRFGLVGLGARAVFAGGGLSAISRQFGLLTRLPKFRLASRVSPLKWGSKLIPRINWSLAGRLGWSSLIKPLVWAGKGALRFIPYIGWAVLAGELLWSALIKPLGWDKYLKKIDWGYWFSFEWVELLPEWNWSDLIPEIDLTGWIRWPEPPEWWLALTSADLGLSSGNDRKSARTGKPAGGRALGGPTHGGLPYLVNEHTPRSEWMVPSASGGVLNVSQAQSVFLRHLRASVPPIKQSVERAMQGARGLQAAGLAVVERVAVPVPAQAAGRTQDARSVTVSIGAVTIPVSPNVTDPHLIAEKVAELLGERVSSTLAASFSD